MPLLVVVMDVVVSPATACHTCADTVLSHRPASTNWLGRCTELTVRSCSPLLLSLGFLASHGAPERCSHSGQDSSPPRQLAPDGPARPAATLSHCFICLAGLAAAACPAWLSCPAAGQWWRGAGQCGEKAGQDRHGRHERHGGPDADPSHRLHSHQQLGHTSYEPYNLALNFVLRAQRNFNSYFSAASNKNFVVA